MKKEIEILTRDILNLKLDNEKYINVDKILNYNAFLYIIMGGRGIGKTTQFIIKCLYDFIDNGNEFIYLRRYKSTTKQLKDIFSIYFKEPKYIKFKGDSNGGGQYFYKDRLFCHIKALSVQSTYKSLIFDKVTTIIYDECIIMRSQSDRYLSNEVIFLFEFLSTVFRNRTNNIKCLCLGNNLDLFNPYFSYFDIKMNNKKFFDKNRKLYVEYCDNSPSLISIEKETPLYSLTKDTAYNEYHYANKLLQKQQVQHTKLYNNDCLLIKVYVNEYVLNIYNRYIKNDEVLICESKKEKPKIEDKKSYILYDNNELNYFYLQYLKVNSLRYTLSYRYFNKKCLYCDDIAFNLFSQYLIPLISK